MVHAVIGMFRHVWGESNLGRTQNCCASLGGIRITAKRHRRCRQTCWLPRVGFLGV